MKKETLTKLWKENKGFILFIALMFVFRSAIADWNHVPSGSMEPTIRIGDRLLVDKMAYDIRVPFTNISLWKLDDPERGDIIIFDSEITGKRMVKRVVGMPGDEVAMRNNILIINGKIMQYQDYAISEYDQAYIENLLGIEHQINIKGSSRLQNFGPEIVPEGHYFAMGDNRNNSSDSRVIGAIPRGEIVGKSERVIVSFDYNDYYLPRSDRWLTPLDPE